MDNVKISSLELENIKRVRAVSLEPTQDGLTVIGGRNAQGKTSILDAIAWALGGDKMRPDAPNRDGAETPAMLHVELSNGIVVERKGKNGALSVTDSRGMKGGQRLLNDFIGQLALDLPKFMGATDKQRADYLMGILGVDEGLARIDAEIKAAFDERTYVSREAKSKAGAVAQMPHYDDAPEQPVSLADLTERMRMAMEANAENERRRRGLADLNRSVVTLRFDRDRKAEEITAFAERLKNARDELSRLESQLADGEAALESEQAMVEALADVDLAPIQADMAAVEDTNRKVEANAALDRMLGEAEALRAQSDALTSKIESLRAERTKMLDDAGMPLPGLSVEDGTLYYDGHVWADMSGAEQLRVATAIVRATKPECGFVLVDKLEQFDTQQLAEFARWCESEGLQVIGTRVATDDSCTVIIEDGMVVE